MGGETPVALKQELCYRKVDTVLQMVLHVSNNQYFSISFRTTERGLEVVDF